MRLIWLFGFVVCAGLIVTGLFMQYQMHLDPCPLCILQRVVIVALGVICLIACIHNPPGIGRRIYAMLVILMGAAGAALAGRHVWIQSLPPDQVPECSPGLDYILGNFPLGQALSMIFTGSGECAEVQWVFLGLSISGWTLVIFSLVMVTGIIILVSKSNYRYY